MSSKEPSCIIEEVVDEPDPTEHDSALGRILTKCEGDSSRLFKAVFGFLGRKSNFFKEGDPQARVLEAFKQAQAEHAPKQQLKSGFLATPAKADVKDSLAAATATQASTAAAAAAPPAQPAAPTPPAASSEAASAGASKAAAESDGAKAEAKDAATVPSVPDEPAAEEGESKGLKPNAGRGYDFDNYSWTQTLSEVSVSIPVPKGTKAKMLDVVIAKNKLKVALKGQAPILEGELCEPIKPDDSLWNLDGSAVELSLAKQDGMHWWNCVLKGDPAIDVHKVEPENSKLSDLDAETRQTVEKMMFDQRQKALGRPTSDELKKQEMLEKFMAAHPEMDFSNAKLM